VDLNVVMSEDKEMVEIQGTAEEAPFPRSLLESLLDLAEIGIEHHTRTQREALGNKLV
jgi:ribonuclease PH